MRTNARSTTENEVGPLVRRQCNAEVRRMGTLEGYCYQHVQAIMIAIDQYAETALGNRGYFLNKPHSSGGMND